MPNRYEFAGKKTTQCHVTAVKIWTHFDL